ncbi:MAG: hypothetical protein HYR55_02095 [Acidobacteria bacterium]|nr:hypothetical protein [Acidobacteriota bacterium]MBI3658577.1 hypothetical protein [Acidobacteriota bacterium]
MKIAILGAGDLGATIARKLAETDLLHEIVLFDDVVGVAQGKALDIMESGPIVRFDTHVSGSADMETLREATILVSANYFQQAGAGLDENRATAFFKALSGIAKKSCLVVAEDSGAHLAELAVLRGRYSPRAVIGSAPMAFAAAVRAGLAQALKASAGEISVPLLGRLPSPLIVPWAMVTACAVPVDRLLHVSATRKLSNRLLQGWRLGPCTLGYAAAALVCDMVLDRVSLRPVLAYLMGEYQQRNQFLVVPARVGGQGVIEIPELSLDPVDRAAFERARHG